MDILNKMVEVVILLVIFLNITVNVFMIAFIKYGDYIYRNSIRTIIQELLPKSDKWLLLKSNNVAVKASLDQLLEYHRIIHDQDIDGYRDIAFGRNLSLYRSLLLFLGILDVIALLLTIAIGVIIGYDKVGIAITIAFVIGIVSLSLYILYIIRIQMRYVFINPDDLHGDPEEVRNAEWSNQEKAKTSLILV